MITFSTVMSGNALQKILSRILLSLVLAVLRPLCLLLSRQVITCFKLFRTPQNFRKFLILCFTRLAEAMLYIWAGKPKDCYWDGSGILLIGEHHEKYY